MLHQCMNINFTLPIMGNGKLIFHSNKISRKMDLFINIFKITKITKIFKNNKSKFYEIIIKFNYKEIYKTFSLMSVLKGRHLKMIIKFKNIKSPI